MNTPSARCVCHHPLLDHKDLGNGQRPCTNVRPVECHCFDFHPETVSAIDLLDLFGTRKIDRQVEAVKKRVCALCGKPTSAKCGCDKDLQRGMNNVFAGHADKMREWVDGFLAEPLGELFDTVPDARHLSNVGSKSANFNAGPVHVVIDMYSKPWGLGYTWDIAFSTEDPENFAGTHTDLTGSGHEFEIFSGVVSIIKGWLSDNDAPDRISFTAKEASRVALYQRMVDRLAPSLGYRLVGAEDIGGETRFELEKA